MFNWRDYFSLAQDLSQRGDESGLRSSISRAYYSAFCIARNHASSQGFRITATGKDHQLVERFYSSRASTRNIGSNLGRLRSARNQCDYQDSVNNLENLTQLSLFQAQLILQLLP